VLYADEHGQEFVYRQPQSPEGLQDLLDAAEAEAFMGYGCDGNEHWTPSPFASTCSGWTSIAPRHRQMTYRHSLKEPAAEPQCHRNERDLCYRQR
jgi:hypothetical protein